MPVWIRAGLTLAALAYLIRQAGGQATLEAAARLDGRSLLVIAMLTAADRAIMVWRWILLVRATGVRLPWAHGVRLYLESSFVGSQAPAGVGGDVARAWQLGRQTSRGADVVAAGVVDRWLGLTSVILLGIYGLANWTRTVDWRVSALTYGFLGLALAGSVLGLWADRVLGMLVPQTWLARKPWTVLTRLAEAVSVYRRAWRTLAWVSVLSLAVQVLRVVLAWVIGRGMGIDVGLSYYLVFMPIGIILILLPISLGGFGPAQGGIVWMMRPLGVPDALSFAMSTVFILAGFVANLPGALLLLTRRPVAEPAHRENGP